MNGHLVDMKERLEDVGCVENSEVVVEAANGGTLLMMCFAWGILL